MGLMLNRSKAHNYARWGNDLRVTDYEKFNFDDATRLADSFVGMAWVRVYNLPTLYSNRMRGNAEGMSDMWHQLNCYQQNVDTMDRAYLPELFDWIKVPYREAPSKRWLSKCIKSIKWSRAPYDVTKKIWKEQ